MLEKSGRRCWRRVLERKVVEMRGREVLREEFYLQERCWRRVSHRNVETSVVQECCRTVLQRSVGEESCRRVGEGCCREVLVVDKIDCCTEMLENSVVQKCSKDVPDKRWGEVLEKRSL